MCPLYCYDIMSACHCNTMFIVHNFINNISACLHGNVMRHYIQYGMGGMGGVVGELTSELTSIRRRARRRLRRP